MREETNNEELSYQANGENQDFRTEENSELDGSKGHTNAPPYAGNRLNAADQKLTYRYAGFWMRLWAYLLDLIIIWSIGGIVIFPIFRMLNISTAQHFMFAPAAIATTLLWYVYFIVMTKKFQQTLGKMVFGLRVIDIAGEGLTWKTILFREGVGRFIARVFAPVTLVVYLVAAFTNKKQGVHDIIADTSVIHEQ